ncbi:hypothetical protein [Fervidibacter sacchari]|uniref:Uncharacterized protein n=1 Tax=Candidatus Fervidibacter sacchari TaxID=1448929 RepID=A0ABT2EUC4_9BACT|nr:hypothetical protein [Candidatus Fervidibacter sacchari]MCS3921056.1 hypothetical protein [Candidatus Fervidibacter sacchari]WKU16586.1 hypothetical protein Q2T83_01875 [Candidatus Fervidibacter sacchari]
MGDYIVAFCEGRLIRRVTAFGKNRCHSLFAAHRCVQFADKFGDQN